MKTDFEEEVWKDIPGYEGLYQVSDMGRVKSLARRKRGDIIMHPKYSHSTGGYYYIELSLNGKSTTFKMNRLVWQTFNGKTDLEIDHINHISWDDRLENLQPLTGRQNATKATLRYHKTSKYTGVHWDIARKKWRSGITINKELIHLGRFDNEEEAALAYQSALAIHNNGGVVEKRVYVREKKPRAPRKKYPRKDRPKRFRARFHPKKGKEIFIGEYHTLEEAQIAKQNFLLNYKR